MKTIRKGILLCLLCILICFLLMKRMLTVDNSLGLIQEFYRVDSDVAFSQKATSFYSRLFISDKVNDPYFLMSPLLLSSDTTYCKRFECYYDDDTEEIIVISEWKSNEGKYYDELDRWTLRGYLVTDKICEYCVERR